VVVDERGARRGHAAVVAAVASRARLGHLIRRENGCYQRR
jgi:hypothetical protein